MDNLSLIVAVAAIALALAVLIRRWRMSPAERGRMQERARAKNRDLAQWGASLVLLGVFLSFGYLVLPQTRSDAFATVEVTASALSVVIAVIALVFAGLATIRRRWARIVFGIPALGAGILLVSARLTDMTDVRDYGLEPGAGLFSGLAAAIAITLGAVLCIAGVATVRRIAGERALRRAGTPLPPPPVPSRP